MTRHQQGDCNTLLLRQRIAHLPELIDVVQYLVYRPDTDQNRGVEYDHSNNLTSI